LNFNALTPEELEKIYPEISKMRRDVLELVKKYGYTASQLVSRTMENELASAYGRKLLKQIDPSRQKDLDQLKENEGCEHTDDNKKCPVCKDKENEN